MSLIKMVIFDLDGVLVDACEWHRVAFNEALKQVCNYEITLKEHYSTFNGIPTKVKLQKLSEIGILKKEKHKEIFTIKQDKTIEIIERDAFKRQEKIDLINFLKDNGCVVCCFTNSIRETTNLMLKKTGIFHLFDTVLTNEDVNKPKPDSEGYNFLVNKYGFDKSQVLIVEDSPKGIEAAVASGCQVVRVKGPNEVTVHLLKEKI